MQHSPLDSDWVRAQEAKYGRTPVPGQEEGWRAMYAREEAAKEAQTAAEPPVWKGLAHLTLALFLLGLRLATWLAVFTGMVWLAMLLLGVK